MPILHTQRLALESMTPSDLEWYAQLAADADVMRFIGAAGALSREQAAARLARYVHCWEEHMLGFFSVRLRGEEVPIGWAGLQPLNGTADIEVGYAFGKSAWGRGFATEVASALVQWGFEDRGLDRIVAVASPENTGSRRVMEKLGMRYEGMRDVYGGGSVYYSVTPAAFASAASLRAFAP
ncbi:MAG: GNAT family N-acetyltransferase [Gemmatimonadota bacterium]